MGEQALREKEVTRMGNWWMAGLLTVLGKSGEGVDMGEWGKSKQGWLC